MAGKSNRGRNNKASQNAAEMVVTANGHIKDNLKPVGEQKVEANGVPPSAEAKQGHGGVKETLEMEMMNWMVGFETEQVTVGFVFFFFLIHFSKSATDGDDELDGV
ncbi:hypothetical protein L1987_03317 [Smallanthus sonchifolius]|uniref:Uncharacterized protein n=1 Tax=Smallanthus sonchifolius TaxID=185202 RepID=A0ACB9KA99_9ASTR|nr:hypothetical protein L1987_03317 [Smallanthus sonchifolius]